MLLDRDIRQIDEHKPYHREFPQARAPPDLDSSSTGGAGVGKESELELSGAQVQQREREIRVRGAEGLLLNRRHPLPRLPGRRDRTRPGRQGRPGCWDLPISVIGRKDFSRITSARWKRVPCFRRIVLHGPKSVQAFGKKHLAERCDSSMIEIARSNTVQTILVVEGTVDVSKADQRETKGGMSRALVRSGSAARSSAAGTPPNDR